MIEKWVDKLSPKQAGRLHSLITNKLFIAVMGIFGFIIYVIIYAIVSLGILYIGINILQRVGVL